MENLKTLISVCNGLIYLYDLKKITLSELDDCIGSMCIKYKHEKINILPLINPINI